MTNSPDNTKLDISGTANNIVICMNNQPNQDLTSSLSNGKCGIIDCSENFRENQNKVIADDGSCISSCQDSSENIYEFLNKCYKECPNGTVANDNFLCEIPKTEKLSTFSLKSLNTFVMPSLFLKTNLNINDKSYVYNSISTIINDENQKTKNEKKGNIFKIIEIEDFDIFCDEVNIISLFCKLNYTGIENNTKDKEIEIQDKILEKIENGFTSNDYNTNSLDEGKDQIIKFKKMEITLTSIENQKKMIKHNKTAIDFSECENLLRIYYNISDNKALYMKKVDLYQEYLKIPKIEYNIYSKLNDTNLIKLNLSICYNIKIDIFIPLIISEDENIDEYNLSSEYYSDICYPAETDDSVDIIIKDRQKEFIEQNKTVCQENCDFSEYNYNTNKAKCSCYVEELSSSLYMTINITKLYESFKDVKNTINIKILKCYKVLFTKEGLIYNIAFYIIIIIISFHFICIVLFYIKGLKKVKKMIEEIVFATNNFDLNKEEEEEEENNSKIQFKKKRKGEDNDDKNNILNINKNRKSLSTMTTENKIIKKIRKKRRTKTGKYKNKKCI